MMVIGSAWKAVRTFICIEFEIDKCDILCANCHVLEHSDIDFFEKHKIEINDKLLNYKEKQKRLID